ncbi:TIGR03435 family protein [Granulicella paludicola]|uniref:TIGR03435 family protein n=1 Tax=Granulicella paludicola TaxID=474951 RepID=UPI0021DF85E5|nr:TIGR03435 family protein [Granulicella paludicola]
MREGCLGKELLVTSLLVVSSLGANAQAIAASGASIDVAVVRPHPASVMHNNFSFQKNRFELEDQPVGKLIAFAYSVNPRQIVEGPGSLLEKHFDMSGTTNLTTDATRPQEQQLVRQLLTERFGLKFHREAREMPAYALQVLKGGPKLIAAADIGAQPIERTSGNDSERTESYTSSTVADFLVIKQLFMDRPLVDQTGLTGRYDFKLTYTFGDAPSLDANAAPPMFTAIKEQLGLKFEPVKAAVEVMVIDHLEQPTEN